MDDTASELQSVLAQLKKPTVDFSEVSSKLQGLANSQGCVFCKEELEMARKAVEHKDVDMASKAVEAARIKFDRMGSMITELDTKGLLNIGDLLQSKYGSSTSASKMNVAADLGIHEVLLDMADLLGDVKELGDAVKEITSIIPSIIPTPDSLVKELKLPAGRLPKLPRIPFLPPIPFLTEEK